MIIFFFSLEATIMGLAKYTPQSRKKDIEKLCIFLNKTHPKPANSTSLLNQNKGNLYPIEPSSTVSLIITPVDLQYAINHIQDNMWRSTDALPSEKLKTNTVHFRSALPKIVLKSQLTGLYRINPTLLEQELFRYCQDAKIRIILINNGLGGSVVIENDCFNFLLERTLQKNHPELYDKFNNLLRENLASTTFDQSMLQSAGILQEYERILVNTGFLTLCNATSQDKTFAVSMPNLGSLLKIIKYARKWVVDSLRQSKNNSTLPEINLQSRWVHSKDFWIKNKGLNLSWILLDCYGGGYCNKFMSPTGTHWKLSGKKL